MQGRQGAGRVQGQGTEGRAGLQDSLLREGRGSTGPGPRPGLREGQGAGQAGRRQGARQGTEGRAGLQDSILRFSRAENPKTIVFATS